MQRVIHPVAILLTGQPGIGKSTIIQKIVSRIGGNAGGFYTREIREKGQRVGFEIVTLEGQTAVLATKSANHDFAHPIVFKGFTVNMDAAEKVAVPALIQAARTGKIVVIDEIGPMEIFSKQFCQAATDLLNTPGLSILGTIVYRPNRFADRIKAHPRVIIKTVTRENRDAIPSEIHSMLVGIPHS